MEISGKIIFYSSAMKLHFSGVYTYGKPNCFHLDIIKNTQITRFLCVFYSILQILFLINSTVYYPFGKK